MYILSFSPISALVSLTFSVSLGFPSTFQVSNTLRQSNWTSSRTKCQKMIKKFAIGLLAVTVSTVIWLRNLAIVPSRLWCAHLMGALASRVITKLAVNERRHLCFYRDSCGQLAGGSPLPM
ncbi:hypothetical protein K438DRAFT_454686 [Mycena galopus ATCC 62051]|nr:hypothetical protein K438DRAFT_454686 [Mycena galopus ATCC 62051]